MFKFLYLAFSIVLLSSNSYADYVVTDAKIDKISNTSGNADEFAIWVSGGSGQCNDTLIKFRLADSGSAGVFNKAYSTALAAFAAGYRIRVHNYHNNLCLNASYIEIYK